MNKKLIKYLIIAGAIIITTLVIVGLKKEPKPSFPPPLPAPTISPKSAPIYIPQKVVHESSTKDYKIIYNPEFDQYIITVLGTDFNKIRSKAEQQLIKQLHLTQDQACQLNVVIGSPYYIAKENTKIFYKFSFCPQP